MDELEQIKHDYIELTATTRGGANYQHDCEHMALTAIPRLIEMVVESRRDALKWAAEQVRDEFCYDCATEWRVRLVKLADEIERGPQ